MSKARLSIVCVLVGFFVAYAVGLRDDPTTLFGWLLLLVGCYIFGAFVLLAATLALTVAGCEVHWPGQPYLDPLRLRPLTENQRNEQLMRVTLSPMRRHLGWAAMVGGLLIGQSIPFVVGYFVGGVWTFVALVPAMLVMVLGVALSDRIWKPYRDAQRSARAPRGSTQQTEGHDEATHS
jgi:hypothetical protein